MKKYDEFIQDESTNESGSYIDQYVKFTENLRDYIKETYPGVNAIRFTDRIEAEGKQEGDIGFNFRVSVYDGTKSRRSGFRPVEYYIEILKDELRAIQIAKEIAKDFNAYDLYASTTGHGPLPEFYIFVHDPEKNILSKFINVQNSKGTIDKFKL